MLARMIAEKVSSFSRNNRTFKKAVGFPAVQNSSGKATVTPWDIYTHKGCPCSDKTTTALYRAALNIPEINNLFGVIVRVVIWFLGVPLLIFASEEISSLFMLMNITNPIVEVVMWGVVFFVVVWIMLECWECIYIIALERKHASIRAEVEREVKSILKFEEDDFALAKRLKKIYAELKKSLTVELLKPDEEKRIPGDLKKGWSVCSVQFYIPNYDYDECLFRRDAIIILVSGEEVIVGILPGESIINFWLSEGFGNPVERVKKGTHTHDAINCMNPEDFLSEVWSARDGLLAKLAKLSLADFPTVEVFGDFNSEESEKGVVILQGVCFGDAREDIILAPVAAVRLLSEKIQVLLEENAENPALVAKEEAT